MYHRPNATRFNQSDWFDFPCRFPVLLRLLLWLLPQAAFLQPGMFFQNHWVTLTIVVADLVTSFYHFGHAEQQLCSSIWQHHHLGMAVGLARIRVRNKSSEPASNRLMEYTSWVIWWCSSFWVCVTSSDGENGWGCANFSWVSGKTSPTQKLHQVMYSENGQFLEYVTCFVWVRTPTKHVTYLSTYSKSADAASGCRAVP